jgi:hypothetical protein
MKCSAPTFKSAIAAAGVAAALASSPASALTINTVFTGGAAHGSSTGTGNLQDVFRAAADWWEAAIFDNFVLDINYGWGALGGGTLGSHSLVSQSGGRETEANITIDNDGSTDWWMDGTPFDASEFTAYNEYSGDLGGGVINTGRVYTGGIGNAGSDYDLFNTVIHEIGHALGMSSANLSFQAEARSPAPGDSDVDVTIAGFAGTTLAVRTTSAHYLSSGGTAQASLGRVVSRGSRHMLSCVDILGAAQLSSFTSFSCDPDNPGSVPSPATPLLIGAGLLAWVSRRRRVIPRG